MRLEAYGQPIYCTAAERFPFNTNGISLTGMGGAAKNLTAQATQSNPTMVAALNSFDIWQNANAAVNETIASLYSSARTLDGLRKARAGAGVNGNPAPVIENLDSMLAVSQAAFGAATGIAPTNTDAIAQSLNLTMRAANIFGMANYLVANPLPDTMTCFYTEGEQYLANAVAMDCESSLLFAFLGRISNRFLSELQGGSVTLRERSSALALTTSTRPLLASTLLAVSSLASAG